MEHLKFDACCVFARPKNISYGMTRVLCLERSIQSSTDFPSRRLATGYNSRLSGLVNYSGYQTGACRSIWYPNSSFPQAQYSVNRCIPKSILAEDFEVIDNTLLPISLSFLDSPRRDN